MRDLRRALLCLATLVLASACGRAAETREFPIRGVLLGVERERGEVLLRHDTIPNFMPAMTMPFKVEDAGQLASLERGDQITATLVVGEVESFLKGVETVGHVELEAPEPGPTPIAVPGEPAPDAALIDQDGNARPISGFRGHPVALTFIYTRCPLPEFCPRMDRQFAVVQKTLKSTPSLADARLVSVTLDPAYDTPPVLKAHAQRLGADPAVWSFLTGAPEEVVEFGARLGLYVERNPEDAIDITHNLRTVVLDRDGQLVAAYTGTDWTPAQLVADLEAAAAPAD